MTQALQRQKLYLLPLNSHRSSFADPVGLKVVSSPAQAATTRSSSKAKKTPTSISHNMNTNSGCGSGSGSNGGGNKLMHCDVASPKSANEKIMQASLEKGGATETFEQHNVQLVLVGQRAQEKTKLLLEEGEKEDPPTSKRRGLASVFHPSEREIRAARNERARRAIATWYKRATELSRYKKKLGDCTYAYL